MSKYGIDPLKSLGRNLGLTNNDINFLKRRGGLLPSADRTRGSMSPNKPHDANFTIEDNKRKVTLNLEFFPLNQQYIQGSHGLWEEDRLNIWNQHFKRLTTPGHLLIAFIATTGSIFQGAGDSISPPTFYDPNNGLQEDTDWVINFHGTTLLGHPFVSAFTTAWRFVRENERYYEVVEVHGGDGDRTGLWLWEIENGQAPIDVQSIITNVGNHETITIGDVLEGTIPGNIIGGFVTALFDRDSSPVVTYPGEMKQVSSGTFTSSKRSNIASRLGDGAWSYGAFSDGSQWNIGDGIGVVPGDWWQQDFSSPTKLTDVSMISLFPWVLYSPSNPSGVLTLDAVLPDGSSTGLDYQAEGAVNYFLGNSGNYSALGLDLDGVQTVNAMRFTYLGATGSPPYGDKDSGWNEIINWFDDPDSGHNIQSADQRNNPIPYHGVFAGGGNALFHPWMYIGQCESTERITAEIYNDLFNTSPWSIVGASMVVPGLSHRLPHIPFPNFYGENFASDNGGEVLETIIETVKIVGSGENSMPTDLYASGVRVWIDGQDVSQFIFGVSSAVVDINNWRWDNVDISHWVRSPGQHSIVVTCDDGQADVDTKIEVF